MYKIIYSIFLFYLRNIFINVLDVYVYNLKNLLFYFYIFKFKLNIGKYRFYYRGLVF